MSAQIAALLCVLSCGAVAAREVLRPDELEFGRQVMRSIYSLDYASAEALCRRMIASKPEEALGYALLARTFWAKQLSAGQGLTIDRFAGRAFYSGTADQRVAVTPEAERSYREASATAAAKAKQKLARDASDLGAMFTLGLVRQTMASYEFSMKGDWWAAFREGEGALTLHNKVLLAVPDFWDARLALAVSYYVVDCLPWTIRWLPYLLHYRGSKVKGKQDLEQVASRGLLLADDARTLLVLLYCRDEEFNPASRQLEQLRQKYPNNYVVRLELAGIALRVNEPRRALSIYESLLTGVQAHGPEVRGLESATVLLRLGVASRDSGDLQRSMRWLEEALASGDASNEVRVAARLEAGKTADLLGRREWALEQYRAVAQAGDFLGTRREAQGLLARPYRVSH